MTIRPAATADAATLARLNDFVHALHVEHRPDVFHPPAAEAELADRFRDFLGREDTLAFVAEVDARPIGYVAATIHRNPGGVLNRPRRFVMIEHIVVDTWHARTGVGAALVEAVRVGGREAGCTAVVTDVWDFNGPAQAFFAALGFGPMRRWLEQPL
ncbi:GNAT family N-acetyltransferase [Nonomuraea monospora]|uniref:GNAT family N-acetyltransferase n=1 Tax=Nonomuraea monospora TaxID=568818 RepID=A0ABP5PI23_9ACTN